MADTQQITGRALVSHGPYQAGGWKLQNVSLRPLRENELLVEVVASGICQTDLHFAGLENGHGVHYPRVMGHEGAGYVRQVGPSATAAQVGDPVLLSFSACQACQCCRRGHPAHCHNFDPINFESTPANRVFWDADADISTDFTAPDIFGQFFGQSSFASWTIVEEESVVNVSGLVERREDLQLLAPLGCGVQTGAGAVIKAANAQPEDTVSVLGLGGVGLSAVMGARIAGCRTIIGVARNQARLELALALGATHVVRIDPNADERHVTEAVRALTDGLGADVTLETTGVPKLIAEGIRMTANKGRIVQLGTAPENAVLSLPVHEFMVAGKQYMGVVEGDVVPREFVPEMIEWVKKGLLPLHEMVGFYQAEDYRTAISDMKSGKTIKPVLLW
ncbi:NAD(P)-dependent alcohol dehydrogenase [Aspergillus vadensis CBS 113365]|uniref:Alcohol dehydrogenase n=1 Tax=Aspergillus vadensis (strain CBS 113365 / IMI 142717 / IBT 24658) TaxID=1448311 RepID=A0A319BFQ4_ASPVC|nr:alcohol dehydrogenase [Aspergillus vadensis CBS 113365]PYH71001.1 alcohol dehydrogenase [Aspergillus vadensis CBS 113365]